MMIPGMFRKSQKFGDGLVIKLLKLKIGVIWIGRWRFKILMQSLLI